jgi:uncharacterized protein YegL
MPEERTLDEFEPIARRQLPLFFLIDRSGSMEGSRIGTVNTVMKEVIEEMADSDIGGADADVRIGVLTFSSGCSWMTTLPVEPKDFVWQKVEANGLTDMGEAFKELSDKLSRNKYLTSLGSTFAPVIIFLTDGEPTDDWKKGLELLKKNNWFKHALKLAVPIGDISDEVRNGVLKEFTGNIEAVLKNIKSGAELKKMLRLVSIASTSFASKSSVTPDEDGGGVGEPAGKYDALLDELHTAQEEPLTAEYTPDPGVDPPTVDPDDEW